MYSLRDAEHLRSRLLELFEAADLMGGTPAESNLHFVVVGAGATGVETAGALRTFSTVRRSIFIPTLI
jgi:NADH dehydrogenase